MRDKDLKIESLQADVNQLVVKLRKHEVRSKALCLEIQHKLSNCIAFIFYLCILQVSEQSLKSLSSVSEKRAEEFENKLEKANEHQFECDLKYFTLQRSDDQQQTALNGTRRYDRHGSLWECKSTSNVLITVVVCGTRAFHAALKTELDSLENVKTCRDDFELAKSTLATETERVRILADEKKTLIAQLNELKRECIAKVRVAYSAFFCTFPALIFLVHAGLDRWRDGSAQGRGGRKG